MNSCVFPFIQHLPHFGVWKKMKVWSGQSKIQNYKIWIWQMHDTFWVTKISNFNIVFTMHCLQNTKSRINKEKKLKEFDLIDMGLHMHMINQLTKNKYTKSSVLWPSCKVFLMHVHKFEAIDVYNILSNIRGYGPCRTSKSSFLNLHDMWGIYMHLCSLGPYCFVYYTWYHYITNVM